MSTVFEVRRDDAPNDVTEFWLEEEGGSVILKAKKKNAPYPSVFEVLKITPEGVLRLARGGSGKGALGLKAAGPSEEIRLAEPYYVVGR